METKCPNCGSEKVKIRTFQHSDDFSYEITCEDCGELIDED